MLNETISIGKPVIRKDIQDKVAGKTKFCSDKILPPALYAKLVISPHAHANMKKIDITQAMHARGVQAVITGESAAGIMTGTFVEDRPPIAIGRVRYLGEPIAVVVANSKLEAIRAAGLIKIEYEQLPVINSPGDAIKPDAQLIHEKLGDYRLVKECWPVQGSNIANHVRIRKGDMAKGWKESEVIVEASFTLGERMRPGYITSTFPKLLAKHDFRRIRFHDLRHSCASLLLANNVPMKQIQDWLGHSDFSTTANIYAHLDYSSKLSSAQAMVEGLNFGNMIEDTGTVEGEEANAPTPP